VRLEGDASLCSYGEGIFRRSSLSSSLRQGLYSQGMATGITEMRAGFVGRLRRSAGWRRACRYRAV